VWCNGSKAAKGTYGYNYLTNHKHDPIEMPPKDSAYKVFWADSVQEHEVS